MAKGVAHPNGDAYIKEYSSSMKRRDFLLGMAASPLAVLALPQGQTSVAPNGDGGPATLARLGAANVVFVDTPGNLYITDMEEQSIRKVIAVTGMIDTVAGGAPGNSGDGGPAKSAQFQTPADVVVDAGGNIYVADMNNSRIRKVTPDGIIVTALRLINPSGLALDAAGNLYIHQLNSVVSRMAAGSTRTTIVAGNGMPGYSGDGGPAMAAQIAPFAGFGGLTADAPGNLYLADGNNQRIRRVTRDGVIDTFAGNGTRGFSGDGGPARAAQLSGPTGCAVDAVGNLYIADAGNNRIRKVTPDGLIRTVAGTGSSGFSGDGGSATSAQLNGPTGVSLDSAGNLYIADRVNGRIRKVSPDGIVRTVAGSARPSSVLVGAPPPPR